jgi:hypothetical protein
MKLTYSKEKTVQSCFKELYDNAVKTANFLIFGKHIRIFYSEKAYLLPDFELVLHKGTTERILAVIEVKSPKEFPYEGNLAERYHEEQLRLKLNSTALKNLQPPTRQEPLKEKELINCNHDTKVSRAICQLWGYMTVNNLRYGILSTFNETFFLKREFCDDQGVSTLQISSGVRIGNPHIPIVGALCYFTSLVLESHLYTSPYSTPSLPRKKPVPLNKYEVANVDLLDFRFSTPTDFKAHHVLAGQYDHKKPALFKLLDTTKSGLRSMFFTELEAYKRLDELQGGLIPTLEQSFLISTFLLAFEIEDCGNPITSTQLHKVYDKVVRALKLIHAKGVVHGDIALRNILINSSEHRIVFIDFGFAKFFGSSEHESEGLEFVSSHKVWKELCNNELLHLEQLL